MKEKQCWSCVYGINRTGEVTCDNGIVTGIQSEENKPDPYDCEFYDSLADDYLADIDKVWRTKCEEQ